MISWKFYNREVLEIKELGIYVHIPFCMQKCYYCDFISYAKEDDKIGQYCKDLKCEIEYEASEIKQEGLQISTIYIGGGTPSYLHQNDIKEIVKTIKENFSVMEDSEISIEINPGTVTEEKLKEYQEVGINRISMGLQSTNNELLKQIGRIHTFEDFLYSYALVKKVGFQNINVDLMFGLPNQTLQDVKESIRKMIELKPKHISLYSFLVEEDTPIKTMIEKKIITLPIEELERQMYWEAKRQLEENDYLHYEISNFAKEGYVSKHNCNCWKQKEYLGFGVAAHSYYHNKRYVNTNSLEEYSNNIREGKITNNRILCEIQTEEEKKKEAMLLGLRMIEGVNIQEFKQKFGENPIFLFRKELNKLVKNGLVKIEENQIKLTKQGLDLANQVWMEFI